MDLLWTPTAIAFRDEVRAILDERLTADLRRVNNDPPPDGYASGASWQPVAGEQARALVERIAAGRLTARSENGISLFLVDVAEVPELELHGYRTHRRPARGRSGAGKPAAAGRRIAGPRRGRQPLRRPHPRVSPRGWLLFAAMCVIWGIPYLLIKVAVDGVSAPVLVFARTAIGAAVLIPLALSRAAWAPVLARWRPVLVFAFFEIVAAWLLLSDAERHLTSSLTGLLIAAAPIIAAVSTG